MATSNADATTTNDQNTEGGAKVTGYQKTISYDRETRDFACYLDGELVGFARNYHEAEVMLDRLVFELLTGGAFRDAA